MCKITKVLAIIVVFAWIPTASAAETVIGSVVRCEAVCVGSRAGVGESLASGTAIYLMEKVSTGAGGRLELGFADGTHLTVGEKAEVVLDEFVYHPNGTSRFHAAIRGAFRYVSGVLGAGATRAASVTTPFAVIGARGTDFWAGPSNGVIGVVLFAGAVSVTNAGGTVILSRPGQGTNLTAPNTAPSPVVQWSQQRIAAALASIAFH